MNKLSPSSNSKGFWRDPLDVKKIRKIRGEVYIEQEICKGCSFCIEFCPVGSLVKANYMNSKGYHPPIFAYPEKCTGCGFCERICPEFAIVCEKINEEQNV